MRKVTVRIGLVEMAEPMALAYCINLTKRVWSGLRVDETFDLWGLIKSYIQNRFQDDGTTIPTDIAEAWSRCKQIIDEEIGQ